MKHQELWLENQICHRLYMASNSVNRAYRPLLDALGLTYPQYVVMMSLWQTDGVMVNELQSTTQIDNGALTLILKKIADKGLISLLPVADDRRKKRVSLTADGKGLQEKAASIPDAIRCRFPSLNDEDSTALKLLLNKLLGDLRGQSDE